MRSRRGFADQFCTFDTDDLHPSTLAGFIGGILHAGGPKLAVDLGHAGRQAIVDVLLHEGQLAGQGICVGFLYALLGSDTRAYNLEG